jgi:hypothetical protein
VDLIAAAIAFAIALIALILELWQWRRKPMQEEKQCAPGKR